MTRIMFKRTKETLNVMWAESTIFWDPFPYPPKEKMTGWKDLSRAFIEDVREALDKD